MFLFLNRCVKGLIITGWMAAAVLVWQSRHHAMPAVDWFQVGRENEWKKPAPLPRISGTVHRIFDETGIQIRDENNKLWNFRLIGIAGAETNLPPLYSKELRDFGLLTFTNMSEQLVGQSVEIAFTVTNLTRNGLGFVYLGTNAFHVSTIAAGHHRWQPDVTRVLPLGEQYALRVSDRRARAEKRGVWNVGDIPGDIPAP